MPLYYIQDSDRPAYVVASTKADAEERWQIAVAKENEIPRNEVGECDGVLLIAVDIDRNLLRYYTERGMLIIDKDFVK